MKGQLEKSNDKIKKDKNTNLEVENAKNQVVQHVLFYGLWRHCRAHNALTTHDAHIVLDCYERRMIVLVSLFVLLRLIQALDLLYTSLLKLEYMMGFRALLIGSRTTAAAMYTVSGISIPACEKYSFLYALV